MAGLLLGLAGCQSASLVTPAPVRLRAAGSTSLAPALRELAAAYEQNHANVLIDVQESGTTVGIRALAAGQADIAGVSWETTGGAPAGARAVPVARDAIAMIVNPDNPVTNLTLLQVKSLYEGESLDWQALGGRALEPVIISREDGSGTRAAFEALLMGANRVTLDSLVMPSTTAVVDYVASHPAAIGYVSAGDADKRVRVLRIEDVEPTPANVAAGAYHLTRLLYLYVPQPTPAATQAFVDYVLSPAGQAIIARRHVPLR